MLAETHSLKPDHIKVFWPEVKVGLLITSSVPHDPPLLEQSQAFNFILFLNLICGQQSLRMIDVKLSILWAKLGFDLNLFPSLDAYCSTAPSPTLTPTPRSLAPQPHPVPQINLSQRPESFDTSQQCCRLGGTIVDPVSESH